MMKRDRRPEHQKIAAFYRSLIMSGDLAPGEQLPPVAQLMERHGVAVHTTQRALNVLRDEGFTETRRGIGVFVRERALVVTEAIEYLALPNRLLDVGEVRPPPTWRRRSGWTGTQPPRCGVVCCSATMSLLNWQRPTTRLRLHEAPA